MEHVFFSTGNSALNYFNLENTNILRNVEIILITGFVFRFISYLGLKFLYTGKKIFFLPSRKSKLIQAVSSVNFGDNEEVVLTSKRMAPRIGRNRGLSLFQIAGEYDLRDELNDGSKKKKDEDEIEEL